MAPGRLPRLLVCVAVLALAGCDWFTDVGGQSGPRGAAPEEPDEQAADEGSAAVDQPAADAVGSPAPDRPVLTDAPAPPEPAVEPAAPDERQQTPREPERDLSAELRQLVGDPSDCLTGRQTPSAEVTLQIRASTSVTGIITRCSVSGAGLDDDARECVRGRLDGKTFRSPVPDAPREVTAELTLRRSEPPPANEGEQEDQPRGVWRYGVFYPGGAPPEGEDD